MEIKELLGKSIWDIEVDADKTQIIFSTDDGRKYKMYHRQDCCESVYIEDIVGDLADLIDAPIKMAEEMSNYNSSDSMLNIPAPEEGGDESYTWTFYKLATIKGYVDIRWFGTSNGYYSESVDFCLIGSNEDY